MKKLIMYSLFIGGIISVVAGVGMIYRPLAPIVGGLFLVFCAITIDKDSE